MGHHARTLTALIALLAATLVAATAADARPSVVRVETFSGRTTISTAFVNRIAVDPAAGVTVTDATAMPAAGEDCAATSPVAALNAAVGPGNWAGTYDSVAHRFSVTAIKGITQPASGPWAWRLAVDQHVIAGDEACTSDVPIGSEVLLYQGCVSPATAGCFSAGPMYMRVRDGGPYDIAPQTVPGRGAPVSVTVMADLTQAVGTVTTDEGASGTSNVFDRPGIAGISFSNPGLHAIMVSNGGGTRAPGRLNVCVSEGDDGYCGSTKVQSSPDIPYPPSPCDTNGHDGLCGTTDTSGPVTHVTNITNKKLFKAKKGPGRVAGTIDTDPNGVGDVKLRLTRVSTVRVKVKAKKSKAKKKPKARYKRVKRCMAWNDTTALLQTTKCGTKYAKWFTADLSDLRDKFTYSFAMTLPAGTYTLEVLATDENGSKDAAAAGRNVLTFTVA